LKSGPQRGQVTRFISNILADLTSSHVLEMSAGKAKMSIRHNGDLMLSSRPSEPVLFIYPACDLRFERRRSALLTDMCRSLWGKRISSQNQKLTRATKMGVVKLNYYLLPPSTIPVSLFLIVVDSFPYLHLPLSSHLENVFVNLVSSLDLIDPRPTHRSNPSQNQIDQFVSHRSTPSST
jgi:hypothetical protein